MTALTRRQIRYFLRRIRTQEESGVALPELPEGFKESFESQGKFRGWINYQVTWDVDDSGWGIVFLEQSLDDKWNELLMLKVPELPVKAKDVSEDDTEDSEVPKKPKVKTKRKVRTRRKKGKSKGDK